MLAARSGGPPTADQGETKDDARVDDERGQALSDLAKKVEHFVGGKGDLEGARFAE